MCREKPDVIVIIKYPKSEKPDARISLYKRDKKRMCWRFRDKRQSNEITPTELGRRLGSWIGEYDPIFCR